MILIIIPTWWKDSLKNQQISGAIKLPQFWKDEFYLIFQKLPSKMYLTTVISNISILSAYTSYTYQNFCAKKQKNICLESKIVSMEKQVNQTNSS